MLGVVVKHVCSQQCFQSHARALVLAVHIDSCGSSDVEHVKRRRKRSSDSSQLRHEMTCCRSRSVRGDGASMAKSQIGVCLHYASAVGVPLHTHSHPLFSTTPSSFSFYCGISVSLYLLPPCLQVVAQWHVVTCNCPGWEVCYVLQT
jgi:hypothetical protein